MSKNLYQCSCGKAFKTAQGLAGHQRFCKKVVRQSEPQEVMEWAQKYSRIQEYYEKLLSLYKNSAQRLTELEKLVNLLIGYVCPGGRNLVGANSYKIFVLSQDIDKAKEEIANNQKTFEKAIKAWVWNVIPERFRPQLY